MFNRIILILCTGLLVLGHYAAYPQAPGSKPDNNKAKSGKKKEVPAPESPKTFVVEGGVMREIKPGSPPDSLGKKILEADSLYHGDSLLLAQAHKTDSLHRSDSVLQDSLSHLTARERRRYQRELADTSTYRHSALFRDSISLSRVCWISAVVPGFGQAYNEQYWKIPVLYGVLGTTLWLGSQQRRTYIDYRNQYDALVRDNATQAQLDEVQIPMIRHNTYKQLLYSAALASYIYFLGDAAVNYEGSMTTVKKATTLSTICPGAGQFYNKSYWKVPIVAGGFAFMVYLIDWNSRGYKRFKLAYELNTDNNPDTHDEFDGRISADRLASIRGNYRRNRDFCIILTGAWYLLNIIDAHSDAYMKGYDISDNLAMTIEPTITTFYAMQSPRAAFPGLNLTIRF